MSGAVGGDSFQDTLSQEDSSTSYDQSHSLPAPPRHVRSPKSNSSIAFSAFTSNSVYKCRTRCQMKKCPNLEAAWRTFENPVPHHFNRHVLRLFRNARVVQLSAERDEGTMRMRSLRFIVRCPCLVAPYSISSLRAMTVRCWSVCTTMILP